MIRQESSSWRKLFSKSTFFRRESGEKEVLLLLRLPRESDPWKGSNCKKILWESRKGPRSLGFRRVRFFAEGRFRFRESFPSGFYCVRREFHLFWSIKRLIILEYKENL
ncbi:Hypothetical protein LBJ_4086 [Leptospira borgpetersenii serovar Hardjo-bovis str. JB197]|uniref:Uncharacterized protein n=1 Tax=Leptospira borgpetersenii serovar Hardjo-bovis (strain JB197) TaxID=355277 RepID=Q04NN9_LEPBJ|nr:Hypothetical protein LBJ_4086 [Leptospira borgpetersenii serovar Hardjo-bovis str. JB197]AMX72733.1 hypothetical protein LBHB_16420 [Leptospira borgpetersenii serovar Hardjo]